MYTRKLELRPHAVNFFCFFASSNGANNCALACCAGGKAKDTWELTWLKKRWSFSSQWTQPADDRANTVLAAVPLASFPMWFHFPSSPAGGEKLKKQLHSRKFPTPKWMHCFREDRDRTYREWMQDWDRGRFKRTERHVLCLADTLLVSEES